jgi:hydrogenase expression/formation protein HypC
MCIGVPGRITRIFGSAILSMAAVDYGAVTRECCLAYVPEAAIGDYVIVQTGFAISLLDPQEALLILEAFDELGMQIAQADIATTSSPGETCTSWP